MGKLKIGVFGAARGFTMIRETTHYPEEATLVAICDKFQPALDHCKQFADEQGVKVATYTNFEDFIQEDMDAVVLANYAHQHAPYAIRLLKSGRSVMSEVLTCATLAEAVELIETVEATGKIYNYAENYCFFNTTTEMRKRYRAGDIGELMQAEGEYIHDCSSIWPEITYGERDHWRNQMSSVFYCTHSLGPIIHASGLRPVAVNGFETVNAKFMRDLGWTSGSSGTLMVTLENGAIVKSIDMCLKREPGSINYQMYGTKGNMETDRWESGNLHVYLEGDRNCVGEHKKYVPEFDLAAAKGAGHWGGDFFTTYYFIHNLLGDPVAKENSIDVYEAVDMCIPGILGFRSILNNNCKIDVPNLRLKSERDRFRYDTFCSFKETGGAMYVPGSAMQKNRDVEVPDEVYEEVRRKWLAGEHG
ncbi:MAG: Gfo/Idh/MocA family oxidoreductase [Clostridia bacterium]|nr:Gfo/Idh/MocA family oxidoreductase [Clostridia bacterium]